MDPDAALATALTAPDEDDRREATDALRGWLSRGGFPPRERVIHEAGVDRRMPLPSHHGRIFLERYRSGWAIAVGLWGGNQGTVVYHRLRKG